MQRHVAMMISMTQAVRVGIVAASQVGLFLAAIALGNCSKPELALRAEPVEVAPPSKDPATARAMIASGAVVIDVRTADEFADRHLAMAVNLPVDELPGRLAEVDRLVGGDRTRPIVVYCAAGKRAARAKAQLEAAGYTRVVNGGGLDDLRAADDSRPPQG
jgi:phage shock protein E